MKNLFHQPYWNAYTPAYHGYGQYVAASVGADVPTMLELRQKQAAGIVRYEYGEHPTYEQADAVLQAGINHATSSGFIFYNSGIDYRPNVGEMKGATYVGWAEYYPPTPEALATAQGVTQTITGEIGRTEQERIDLAARLAARAAAATGEGTQEPVYEEKKFPWGWVAVGVGGAAALGLLVYFGTRKKVA